MNDRRSRRHGGGGGGRYRGRGGRRFNGGYRSDRGERDGGGYKKKSGGILGFLKRLFGLEKKEEYSRSPRTPRHAMNPAHSSCCRVEGSESSPSFEEGSTQAEPQREIQIEVHTPKLYIGNLSYETSESDLFDLFSQVGAVNNVEVVRDRQSNSKGFGFIEMQSVETAQAAVEKYNGTEFMGRSIVVNGAKS